MTVGVTVTAHCGGSVRHACQPTEAVSMSFVAVSLVAFVFAFVGSLPLAGPIALLVVSNAARGRYREARRIAFGAAAAEGVYAFLAFWGFATFLARHALVLPISHGVTAVVLSVLGARFAFFTMKGQAARASDEPKPGRFWLGFSISAINPTLLVTWGAVTTFLYSRQLVQFTGLLAIPFGLFAATGIATWGLMTVGLLRHFQLPRAALTWVVRAMGVVMIGIAVWSGVELGRYILPRDPHPKSASAAQSRMPGWDSGLQGTG
jgi:threonine/homoserine/homoserine lactone efflux protein